MCISNFNNSNQQVIAEMSLAIEHLRVLAAT